jgi:two-component system chemotaxis response regulator CheB
MPEKDIVVVGVSTGGIEAPKALAAGLYAVKERGGTTVVQNPEDALAPSMPLNAIKHVEVDHILPVEEIAPLLARMAGVPAAEEGEYPVSDLLEAEVKIALEDEAIKTGIMDWGEPSLYACPECHGVLLQFAERSHVRFRCHTGHAYSAESLMAEMSEKTEESLWSALRSIEENVMLMRRLAEHHAGHAQGDYAEALLRKVGDLQQGADQVRQVVMKHRGRNGNMAGRTEEG